MKYNISEEAIKNLKVPATKVLKIINKSKTFEELKQRMCLLLIAQSSLYWDKESKKYDAALKQYAKFSDLFKDPADHKRVITAMIKYDLIDPETHKWIDKGGSRKDLLCSIFRTCHEKKYFRFEKPFPIKALRVIASKTFDLSIGDRTLKGSKALSIKNPYYKWIFAPVQS